MRYFLPSGPLLRATTALLLLGATATHGQVPRRYPAPAASVAGSTPLTSRPPDFPLTPAPRYAGPHAPGTYRLPDGSWHSAEVFGPDMPDRVRLQPESLPDYAVFLPTEVAAYVVRGDTFVTVPAFVRRKHHRLVPAGFAQRLYRDGGYELLLVQAPTPETLHRYDEPTVPNGPAVPVPGREGLAANTPAHPADAYHNSFLGIMLDLFVAPRANQTLLLHHAGQVQELPAKSGPYRQLMLHLLADDSALCAQLRAGRLGSRRDASQLLATYAAHRREALLHAQR